LKSTSAIHKRAASLAAPWYSGKLLPRTLDFSSEQLCIEIFQQDSIMSDDEGGGGMGWLIWIGGLLLINLFNWGFWLY